MNFILQKEKNQEMDIDLLTIKGLLDPPLQKYIHTYKLVSLDELSAVMQNSIPIGTIEFVTQWYRICHNIDRIYPIEIPQCLRTEEFLKRDYRILPYKDLPKSGSYFIKDASMLKQFSYSGEISNLFDKVFRKTNQLAFNKEDLFQISEVVNIISEYRVFIISGKIKAITNYNGDPCIFPDMKLIQKANLIYSIQPDYPVSYTMDIIISDKGTCLCEIHPFISCGLYSTVWGTDLLYAYRDGIDYVLQFNHETAFA